MIFQGDKPTSCVISFDLSIFYSLAYMVPSWFIRLAVSFNIFFSFLLLRFVTGDGILLFSNRWIVNVPISWSQRFFWMNVLSLNICLISFVRNTLQILIIFTKSTRSSSNGINSLRCGGHLLFFKPNLEPLAQNSFISLLWFMKKIDFHGNFFINTWSFLSAVVYVSFVWFWDVL